ncbi:MAG: DHHA1 domain-containing protein, partial [Spirochaetota bacterium]
VKKGTFKTGDSVTAQIDSLRRNLIKANHSATHLLQAALRQVLGDHVKQAGSFVDAERLRFDFSHFEGMSAQQIEQVEAIVNEKIWLNLPAATAEMSLEDALKTGAMAEFGEKYGQTVRVVTMGDFSRELCGGTHVDNTGKIGVFKILKESSPGAGVRRIEGITLKGVAERYAALHATISSLVQEFNSLEKDIAVRAADLVTENKYLQKEIQKMRSAGLALNIDAFIAEAVDISGICVIARQLESASADDMRALSDMIREKAANAVVVFASDIGGKAMLLAAANKPAVDKGADAGAVIKKIAPIVGGGGGGRKDMAQAGGKDPSKIAAALEEAVSALKGMIK